MAFEFISKQRNVQKVRQFGMDEGVQEFVRGGTQDNGNQCNVIFTSSIAPGAGSETFRTNEPFNKKPGTCLKVPGFLKMITFIKNNQ